MKKGMTLIEIMIVLGLLVFVIAALLGSYLASLALNEHNLRFSRAMNLAREAAEVISYRKDTQWDAIVNLPTTTLTPQPPLTIAGETIDIPVGYSLALYVDTDINTSIKRIRIVVCWRDQNGRINGEDNGSGASALNGRCNSGECGANNQLNSPCELTLAIAKQS